MVGKSIEIYLQYQVKQSHFEYNFDFFVATERLNLKLEKNKYSNYSVVVQIWINIQRTHCRTDEVLTNKSHNNICNTHTYEQTN